MNKEGRVYICNILLVLANSKKAFTRKWLNEDPPSEILNDVYDMETNSDLF